MQTERLMDRITDQLSREGDVHLAGPGQWKLNRIVAQLEDPGWLSLRDTQPTTNGITPWKRLGHPLRGGAKWAMHRNTLERRAELVVTEDAEEVLDSGWVAETVHGVAGSSTKPLHQPAPSTEHLREELDAAEITVQREEDGRLLIDVFSRGTRHEAWIRAEQGVHIEVTLLEAEALDETSRDAVARLLLHTAGLVRLVSGWTRESEDGVRAGLELRLPGCSGQLAPALGALQAALEKMGRELRHLAEPETARTYLDSLHGEHSNKP